MRTPANTLLLSRRRVLKLSGAAALSSVALSSTACGKDEDVQATVDSLTVQLGAARVDAADATAAIAVYPEYAGALTTVAAERSAHGDALSVEIDRAAGVDPSATSTAPPTTTPVRPPPGIDVLRQNIRSSQRSAADAARNESGYRAGLLGSISASCAVSAEVGLA